MVASKAWGEVCMGNLHGGPISAMFLSLHRIGWSMEDPFYDTTDLDDKLWLPGMAPKLYATLLEDGSRRQL